MQQLLPLACFIPMVNFLGVLILIPTLPFTFQMYLCFGAMTWSIIAIRGGWLLGDDLVVASLRDGPAAEKRAQTLARLKAENDEMQGLCSKPDEEGRACLEAAFAAKDGLGEKGAKKEVRHTIRRKCGTMLEALRAGGAEARLKERTDVAARQLAVVWARVGAQLTDCLAHSFR